MNIWMTEWCAQWWRQGTSARSDDVRSPEEAVVRTSARSDDVRAPEAAVMFWVSGPLSWFSPPLRRLVFFIASFSASGLLRRRHERLVRREAVCHQNDREQRARDEGSADGPGHGEPEPAEPGRSGPPEHLTRRYLCFRRRSMTQESPNWYKTRLNCAVLRLTPICPVNQ